MARAAAVVSLATVAACAGMDPDYRVARESWRGATYDEVVAAWGQPARSDKAGSQDTYTWFTEDRAAARTGSSVGVGVGVGRGSSGVGVGVGGVIFGAPSSNEAVRCDRTLVFREGRAVDENWAGDPEFCKRFARRK